MRRAGRLAAWIAPLALIAPAAAAGTLVVGPGQPFTDIQAAIDAASAGDVILVEAGAYAPFAVTKPVRILGAGSAAVRIDAPFAEGVHVEGIGAGAEVVISGMEVSATPVAPFGDPYSIHAKDCAGTVLLHDLLVANEPQVSGLYVEGCARVLLMDSSFLGAGASSSTVTVGAVRCDSSTLWIANTVAVGFHPGITGIQLPGAEGLEADSSTLHVWRSELRGGNGSGGKPAFFVPPDGGNGATLQGSTMRLYGGPTTILAGGNGVDGGLFGGTGEGGHGIDLLSGSFLLRQTDVPILGGFDGTGTVQQAAIGIDGTSSLTPDPTVHPALVATVQQGAIGGSFSLLATGSPGATALTFVSFGTGPDLSFPGVSGTGVLDFSLLLLLGTTTLDPTGFAIQPVFVPPNPNLVGAGLLFQSVAALGAQVGVSNPVLVPLVQ